MPIYGYIKSTNEPDGPHTMSEITVDFSHEDLRRFAEFLIDSADRIQSGTWRSNHRHIDEFHRDWLQSPGACDVIVMNPKPEPPAVVRTFGN